MMDAPSTALRDQCAAAAFEVAEAIIAGIRAAPLLQRSGKAPSALKPGGLAAVPDVIGEEIAFRRLQQLSNETGQRLLVMGDRLDAPPHAIAPQSSEAQSDTAVYVYLDAVDGTLKLSGLGSVHNRLRLVNDGAWAVGVAMTDPTPQPLEALRIGDFTVSVIADGNPASHALYPTVAVAVKQANGRWVTRNGLPSRTRAAVGGGGPDSHSHGSPGRALRPPSRLPPLGPLTPGTSQPGSSSLVPGDQAPPQPLPQPLPLTAAQRNTSREMEWQEAGASETLAGPGSSAPGEFDDLLAPPATLQRLYTSSCANLQCSFVHLDAFQACDRSSARPGSEALAAELFAALFNRNQGGAFDVLRTYGTLAAFLRNMLGWRLPERRAAASAAASATAVEGSRLALLRLQLGAIASDYVSSGSNAAAAAGVAPLSGGCAQGGGSDSGGGHALSAAGRRASSDFGGGAPWLEPQCVAFLTINENLHNLIPCVPVLLGAGGLATDFSGRPLAERRLVEGRADILYSANDLIHVQLLELVRDAAARASGGGEAGGPAPAGGGAACDVLASVLFAGRPPAEEPLQHDAA